MLFVGGLKEDLKEDQLQTQGFLIFPNPAPPEELLGTQKAPVEESQEASTEESAASPSDEAVGRCLICHRELTDPESQSRGIGPTCFGNMRVQEETPPENLDEVVALIHEAALDLRSDPFRAASIIHELSALGATGQ